MSKLWDADPLIVALFDLPDGLQAFSNIDLRANDTASHTKKCGGNRRRSSHDNGIDSDNASPIHGESISFTDADEDYSDAVDQVKPPNNPRPLLFTSFFPNYGPPFEKLPSFNNAGKSISRKKSKKRRPDSIKASTNKVDRKGARSSFTPCGDAESPISFTTSGPSSIFSDDNNQSSNIPQHKVDDLLSLDRVTNLKLKIQRIRMSIHSLENDLIATRSELVRAHKHLHFATLELDGIKRAAFEADFGLFRHVQQQELLSSSSRSASGNRSSPFLFFDADNMSAKSSTFSNSTDRLHYLTPCSTFDGDESDNSTPRSTGSYDSFYSLTEIDHTNTNILHARTSTEDKDKTPLKRNSKLKQVVLTDETEAGRESISICTPSTMASSQEENSIDQRGDVTNSEPSGQGGRRNKICRHDSFIRAHDLTLSEGVDSSIVSLQTTDVSDIANALFQLGYECAMDESDRWTPEQGTGKLLSKRANNGDVDGPIGDWPNAACGDEVLVWTSKCIHGGHGSEYPLVKARGLIPTSALHMIELLLDSTRVKEYNKMSLGRIDEHCFATGVERLTECPCTGLLGELKIVRSKSQPPVVRKPIELRLLLHARRLHSEVDNSASYLTIGRSIWETDKGTANTDENSVTRCEMLLSVNLIRDVPSSSSSSDDQKMCEITTITHGISPGIPISIGKRIGLAAAIKYIRDIRAVFESAKKDS